MNQNRQKNIPKAIVALVPVLIPVVGFCATPFMPGSAQDFDLSNLSLYHEAQDIRRTLDENTDIYFDTEDGLMLSFAQDDHDSTLSLYVRANTFDDFDDQDLAHQLNDIEPSVGVEFSVDF